MANNPLPVSTFISGLNCPGHVKTVIMQKLFEIELKTGLFDIKINFKTRITDDYGKR